MKLLITYLPEIIMTYIGVAILLFLIDYHFYMLFLVLAVILEASFLYIDFKKVGGKQLLFYSVNIGLIIIIISNFPSLNPLVYCAGMILQLGLLLQFFMLEETNFIDYSTFISNIRYKAPLMRDPDTVKNWILSELTKISSRYDKGKIEKTYLFAWFPFIFNYRLNSMFKNGVFIIFLVILPNFYRFTIWNIIYLIYFVVFFVWVVSMNKRKLRRYVAQLAANGWLEQSE